MRSISAVELPELVTGSELEDRARVRVYLRVRRVVDIGLCILLVPIWVPLMLIIAIAVRLDSDGPVIFRQQRLGRAGRRFQIYKFRTMLVDAPHFSAAKVGADHPLVTRVGGFLRRSCLDELPQLLNVLKGEMSWVGPRPEQEPLALLYPDAHAARGQVPPGVTGWWQVHHRDDSALADGLAYDLEYLQRFGAAMDLRVLGATVRVVAKCLGVAVIEIARKRRRGGTAHEGVPVVADR